ncbi:MAG: penicillin amidase, partial [Thermoleophilaceae bacterium]|nr:penicillin amidase [Thermoleophilaceae bacterium]
MRPLLGALAGAGALGLLAAHHRLLRSPLPQTTGELRVDGLDAPVTIARDALGVPRVSARSREDLAFGQGFAVGQDRLFQLEFFRRAASGRVAEFAGEEGLLIDRVMRTFGFRQCAEREAAALDRPTRELLEAYGHGVDAAVAAARALPLELQLLRIEPGPWTPVDSLVVGKLLALGFSTNMEAELFRADLIQRVGIDRAGRLEPLYPQGHPVAARPGTPFSGDALGLAEQLADVREALGLGAQAAGSNNWVVSGDRSVTGKPLLAGDPHITAAMPNLWYAIELEAPDV